MISNFFDENEDSTRGPNISEKEMTNDVCEDSEDSEDFGNSEDTLSKNDENLEEVIPELKEEASNVSDALGAKS